MRVLLLFLMMLLAVICHADSHWIKMEAGGDKVEQIPGDIVYNYQDDLAYLNIVTTQKTITLHPINQFAWDYHMKETPTISANAVTLTIATSDLKGNRTGYYPDIIAILFPDHSGFMILDVEGLNEIKIQSIISDYLINKSGSVVFRLKNFLYETLDIEVKTIKTLGYEDTINNRHVDGDVDMRGM